MCEYSSASWRKIVISSEVDGEFLQTTRRVTKRSKSEEQDMAFTVQVKSQRRLIGVCWRKFKGHTVCIESQVGSGRRHAGRDFEGSSCKRGCTFMFLRQLNGSFVLNHREAVALLTETRHTGNRVFILRILGHPQDTVEVVVTDAAPTKSCKCSIDLR